MSEAIPPQIGAAPEGSRLRELFVKALSQSTLEGRHRYVNSACGQDENLRNVLLSLLNAHERVGNFLDLATAGQAPTLTTPEESGQPVGHYKLLRRIGEGGCGVVYLAEQEQPVRRRVALKIIKLGMDTRLFVARFEAERQALALMEHPNIAKVFDAGATETGRPYFVMELVEGIKITEYCDQNKLSTRERLDLFQQACHAIQHAHLKGIIHRDIKPSNILVTSLDGSPILKVIDFGIAKATTGQRLTEKTLFTACEQFLGTPAYMSPEQAALGGMDIDTRSDIYSLGVLLYEMLTGRTPFDGKELLEAGLDQMRRTIRDVEPARPSLLLQSLSPAELDLIAVHRQAEPLRLIHLIRGDLDWIVTKTLEKDRSRRYETANGLAMDLLRYLNHEPVLARPPTNLYRFQKLVRRNKGAVIGVTGLAASLLFGLGLSTSMYRRERAANRRAQAATLIATSTQSSADFQSALRLIDEGHRSEALAHLQQSLIACSTNDAALTRLVTLLTYNSWTLPSLTLPHSGATLMASFSPDGGRVLTASEDHAARLWDAKTGQQLGGLMQHRDLVRSAEFSRDGKKVVTASSDHTARIWDVATARESVRPLLHNDKVLSAQFSPDGKKVATAAEDHAARVWDVLTGELLTKPMKHGDIVLSAEFNQDETRIVTASRDGTARVWDAATGEAITPPLSHGDVVMMARFSPDGTKVITAAQDHTARVWSSSTGAQVIRPLDHKFWVWDASFSPDGRRIATASWDGTARLWDAESGQLLAELKHEGVVWSAQFSSNGRHIATTSADGTARVWDAFNGQPITEPLRHGGWVRSARFSLDGTRLVTACADNMVRVWDSLSGAPLVKLMKHDDKVRSAQFSPNGRWIATASADETARLWNTETGQQLGEPLRHDDGVWTARFSPSGREIVTASSDTTARIWSAEDCRPLSAPLKHKRAVVFAEFSHDGQLIVTASQDHTARVWAAQSGEPLSAPLTHQATVNSAQFSPNDQWIVTASRDGTAQVWDWRTSHPVGPPMRHRQEIATAQFSPDGKWIVTCSADRTARIWEAGTGRTITEPLVHTGGVLIARFSPDGSRILTTSGENGTARVWNSHSGEPLTDSFRHRDGIFGAEFSPDGRRMATGSGDFMACLWNVDTAQVLSDPFNHGAWVVGVQFSRDGKQLLTASFDHAARVWDLTPSGPRFPDWLLPLAEAVSGVVLSPQGLLRETKLNRLEVIGEIRDRLNHSGDSNWTLWGRWFLRDPSARTISPFSKVVVNDAIRADTFESEGLGLQSRGRLDEAEARYRDALALRMNVGPPSTWEETLNCLIGVLMRKRQYSEAKQLCDELLPPRENDEFSTLPLHRIRTSFFARRALWGEALTEASRTVAAGSTNKSDYLTYALLQVARQDWDAYRQQCHIILDRFGWTRDAREALQIARECLVAPARAEDQDAIGRLAAVTTQVRVNHRMLPSFQFCNGLNEYRSGRFASSLQWTQAALRTIESNEDETYAWDDYLKVEIYAVQALTHCQLRRTAEARTSLDTAIKLSQAKLPHRASGDLGLDWRNWIIAHSLLNEAMAALQESGGSLGQADGETNGLLPKWSGAYE